MVITGGKEGEGRKERVKGYMVMAGDLTLGGEHTILYTDDVL